MRVLADGMWVASPMKEADEKTIGFLSLLAQRYTLDEHVQKQRQGGKGAKHRDDADRAPTTELVHKGTL